MKKPIPMPYTNSIFSSLRTRGSKILRLACLALAVSCTGTNGPVHKGDDVGNGGNPPMMTMFHSTRIKLRDWLGQGFRPEYVAALADAQPHELEWIELHWSDLTLAVDAAEFVETTSPQPKCGSTVVGDLLVPIKLYEPVCSVRAPTVDSVAAVIIHESIHHLGIASEWQTDRYTQLLSRLTPTGFVTSPQIWNSSRESDLICEDLASEGVRKILADKVGDGWQVKLYRFAGEEYIFEGRYWCEAETRDFWTCGPHVTLTSAFPAFNLIAHFEKDGGEAQTVWCE